MNNEGVEAILMEKIKGLEDQLTEQSTELESSRKTVFEYASEINLTSKEGREICRFTGNLIHYLSRGMSQERMVADPLDCFNNSETIKQAAETIAWLSYINCNCCVYKSEWMKDPKAAAKVVYKEINNHPVSALDVYNLDVFWNGFCEYIADLAKEPVNYGPKEILLDKDKFKDWKSIGFSHVFLLPLKRGILSRLFNKDKNTYRVEDLQSR